MKDCLAVVIPCFKVKDHILSVISKVDQSVSFIYVVDDACPEKSGEYVQQNCKDPRVKVLFHEVNLGVGGAVKTGYTQALNDKVEIIIKIDGDGQMDPTLIGQFILPIAQKKADYVKGNRFYSLSHLKKMPKLRLFGNSALSFIAKLSSGYWDVMDPTNGFIAIHKKTLACLELDKIDNRYFFENDMLFRLNLVRAVVLDYPMQAVYGDEKSNLNILNTILVFPLKYVIRMMKRIFYTYYLRDFNLASLCLVLGLPLFIFGFIFSLVHWHLSTLTQSPATAGTVMVGALPLIFGFQLILFFFGFDIMNIPKRAVCADE